MSEDMAAGDKATVEEAMNGEEASARVADAEAASSEPPSEPVHQQGEETAPEDVKAEPPELPDVKEDTLEIPEVPKEAEIKSEKPSEPEDVAQESPATETDQVDSTGCGIKRRASEAFSDDGGEEFKGFDDGTPPEEDFKGFESIDEKDASLDYTRIIERLEAEVEAAKLSYTPLKTVVAMAVPRASKRLRQDTDGSRPSSALSARSDGDGGLSNDGVSASSPMGRGRRATTEMSSPLLRVPLERGWKRELVYRAALDSHSRRNADIYYYTPHGKKLRSTREVGEHLSGTGLTLENFSFFKEPLGIDDPEKEIIRDAKMMRKAESPVTTAVPVTSTVEGKRTPKPKAPKGASPEPATPKSPPAKIKVKSVGSRLSGSGAPGKPAPRKPAPAPALQENNNSAAWKKPRQPAPAPASAPPPALAPAPAPAPAPARQATPPPAPPPPLQSRPQAQAQPDIQSPRQLVQPCSMTCGRGVPTLACAACLCLYHPACVHHTPQPGTDTFYCKNCRKSTSPPREPPPLIHKSGAPAGSAPPAPRRVSVPVPVAAPVPVPVPVHANKDKRVLLRMKVAGGGPDGERVWAVAPAAAPPPRAAPRAAPRPALPQSLAVINGRRFIVVPRNMIQPPHQ